MLNISISNYFVRAVLHHAPAAGLDRTELLRQAGIPPELFDQHYARISAVRFAMLQAKAVQAMGDEFLGYGPRRLLPGTWANMCHAVIHCPTLGEALDRCCSFYRMFEDGLQPTLERHGEHLRITIEAGRPDFDYTLYAWEQMMYTLHRFASWLVRQHVPLVSIDMAAPVPAHIDDYRHVFLGQPVQFDRPRFALTLSSQVAALPLEQNEQSLHHFLHHPLLVLLVQQYKQQSWSQRVRQALSKNLHLSPTIDDIAADLKLHQQTLRRRLASEGASYNEIKNQCRRDTALYYLGKPHLSIEHIALQTGFSETSAFTRAFKQWTGVPPRLYRRRQ